MSVGQQGPFYPPVKFRSTERSQVTSLQFCMFFYQTRCHVDVPLLSFMHSTDEYILSVSTRQTKARGKVGFLPCSFLDIRSRRPELEQGLSLPVLLFVQFKLAYEHVRSDSYPSDYVIIIYSVVRALSS